MVRMPHPLEQEKPLVSLARSALTYIGENPMREGLLRTPERFEKALRELTSGYASSPEQAVGEGVFDAEGSGLVSVKDIEFFSLCEHHILPFWGHVSISYLPNKKILGLSKLGRIVDVFAKRLQVQERLTREVAESIHELIGARAVCVKVEARHMCMMMRGVGKKESTTHTEFSVKSDLVSEDEIQRLWKSIDN